MSVSTGSVQCSVTSTTLVSNSTRCVRSVLMPKKMAAVTAAVDHAVGHAAGLVDEDDDLPAVGVPADAGEEVRASG